MYLGSAGTGKILQKIGRDLSGDKEIALSLAHADIPDGLPGNARSHECAKKIPMRGGIPVEKLSSQTHKRRIFGIKRIFFPILRQINEHPALRTLVAAKGDQTFLLPKQIPAHIQLPQREKSGVRGNVFPHTGAYFVPDPGQKHTIVRGFCDFLNIAALHTHILSSTSMVLYHGFFEKQGSFPCLCRGFGL